MIDSIVFNGEKGYVGRRVEEAVKPKMPYKPKEPKRKQTDSDIWYEHKIREYKRNVERYEKDSERYKLEMKGYREELANYKKHAGEYSAQVSKYLVGREIRFDKDKVNLIFGPNASGKTTILKSIASLCLCDDGWGKPVSYFSLKGCGSFINNRPTDIGTLTNLVAEYIDGKKPSSFDACWDGDPIYYHNFENRVSAEFGDLCGSVIDSAFEEMNWWLECNQASGAEKGIWILTKLLGKMKSKATFEDLYGSCEKGEYQKIAYDAQKAYYDSLKEKSGRTETVNTFLFDEIDKSMDINNVISLYRDVLPDVVRKTGQQVIVVSHSPIVLQDKVYKSDRYNFISIDEEYTERCRKELGFAI